MQVGQLIKESGSFTIKTPNNAMYSNGVDVIGGRFKVYDLRKHNYLLQSHDVVLKHSNYKYIPPFFPHHVTLSYSEVLQLCGVDYCGY